LCGGFDISLARLSVGLQIYKNYIQDLSEEDPSPGLRAIDRTTELWKKYSINDSDPAINGIGDFNILSLVEKYPKHNCSDAIDRIYSLYALASNIGPKTLADGRKVLVDSGNEQTVLPDIDYTLGIQDTYKAFAIACMSSGKMTRILESALAHAHLQDPELWPSWLPDWRLTPNNHARASLFRNSPPLRFLDISGNSIRIQTHRPFRDFLQSSSELLYSSSSLRKDITSINTFTVVSKYNSLATLPRGANIGDFAVRLGDIIREMYK
jgi:hypothetical protein